MILITGFEPFGLIGRILKINPSEEVARKLYKEIKENVDLLILPVNKDCINILKNELENHKYKFIFMMGYGGSFRIETRTSKGEISKFARRIKEEMGLMTKENIGDYYCDKVYSEALKYNPKTIFIHLPIYPNYLKIKDILNECKKW